MNGKPPAVPGGEPSDRVAVGTDHDESMPDVVEEADRESFPASDPPSWWAGGPTGSPGG